MSKYTHRQSKGAGGGGGGDKTDKDYLRLKNIVSKLSEESKIKLDTMIEDFATHPNLLEIAFPKNLSSMERAYVHYQAVRKGFKSFSSGSGADRRLTLQRVSEKNSDEAKFIALTNESSTGVASLVSGFGSMAQNGFGAQQHTGGSSSHKKFTGASTSRLAVGPFPKIPKPRWSDAFVQYQRQLPIWEHKEEILKTIDARRVVFIRGSTGCGKTTQVGQYILDDALEKSKKVRIVCTVPRRIAAVTVSERVAQERGEPLGQTVGYQIRLESCISPVETLLAYCTSGVLLRSLAGPEYTLLKNTTHIIIDEVHERDRQTDFLLACLKDILTMFPDLKLILMGADLNDELFTRYFGGEQACPIIQVEGRLHQVNHHFLEDILELLNYKNNEMKSVCKKEPERRGYRQMMDKLQNTVLGTSSLENKATNKIRMEAAKIVLPEIDELIQQVWISGDEELSMQYLNMVMEDNIPVDYGHSEFGVTMLMAATVHGLESIVSALIQLGADVTLKSSSNGVEYSAIDWAKDHGQHVAQKLLMEEQYNRISKDTKSHSSDSEKCRRLETYLKSVDEERVDLMLTLRIIQYLHETTHHSGAILVFLPGYDEIVTLKHLILTDDKLRCASDSFRIFMLHSNIQTGDQRAAFSKLRGGTRKIVLSTNIAETSLTIEDIVYVIDSGKAKEKAFDSLTGVSQLKSVWISKASVNQRRGRAGRCQKGYCFHLFSSARYEAMLQYPVPEIMRTSLLELCLHARAFLREGFKIVQFFENIPEPPATHAVDRSVELLKEMGALDQQENLTKLGHHLLVFPLEPFFGKALFYAVTFKCLDPILTIVSIISYGDPFQLPGYPSEQKRAHDSKNAFGRNSFSDHMAYLKAFQDWEKAKLFHETTEKPFCRDIYLSSVSFEMIYSIRSRFLGQLRASRFVKNNDDLKILNMHSDNWALVKGVLVATLYPNICGINREKKVLHNKPYNFIEYRCARDSPRLHKHVHV